MSSLDLNAAHKIESEWEAKKKLQYKNEGTKQMLDEKEKKEVLKTKTYNCWLSLRKIFIDNLLHVLTNYYIIGDFLFASSALKYI